MTFEAHDADVDAALRSSARREALVLPVMTRRTPLAVGPEPEGTALRWLDESVPADLEDLRDVLRRGFAEDDEEREIMDSLLNGPAAIAKPGVAAAVSTLDGQPAACALVYRVGDEAVVGWVATVPDARGQGLGGHITTAVTNRGFDLGASLVTLQASPMGLRVYVRLGYETIMSSRIWVAPEGS
jgi:GNAT superfamily N-acetyltransferase